MEELAVYPYAGHSALLGRVARPWQAVDEVVGRFGTSQKQARQRYEAFVGYARALWGRTSVPVVGPAYSGRHGLRWNYAQRRLAELTEAGLIYEKAMSVVSKEMGHERADITGRYLR